MHPSHAYKYTIHITQCKEKKVGKYCPPFFTDAQKSQLLFEPNKPLIVLFGEVKCLERTVV